MTYHARKPTIITLLAALGVSAAGLAAAGQFRAPPKASSLAQLERVIASGSATAATWNDYGDALRAEKRFTHAAAAYQRSLDLDPDRPSTRISEALALAQAGAPEKFFAYFEKFTANDPKQAVDLLDRPELASLRSNPEWKSAVAAARAQAAD